MDAKMLPLVFGLFTTPSVASAQEVVLADSIVESVSGNIQRVCIDSLQDPNAVVDRDDSIPRVVISLGGEQCSCVAHADGQLVDRTCGILSGRLFQVLSQTNGVIRIDLRSSDPEHGFAVSRVLEEGGLSVSAGKVLDKVSPMVMSAVDNSRPSISVPE